MSCLPGGRRGGGNLLLALSIVVVVATPVSVQQGAVNGEWRYYAGDAGSTKYSPLDQINASNVKDLEIVWRWKAENFGPRADFNWEVTPLMVGGVLYFTAGTRRDAVAVDAATGETLWMYRLDEGERGARAVRTNNRGLAYWTDGGTDQRILLISPGYQLIALNAKTGTPIPNFGKNGIVELTEGLDREIVKPGQIGASSPAIVVRDTVVVGAAMLPGTAPPSKTMVPGYIRGFDVRTGKRRWTFRTIPHAGEFGNETWENDSWKYTGNTGAYQLVHHDIWDWDVAAAPILLDVTVDGKKIKAVAQPTKQAFLYVFDRVTGRPVWPIEERAVPQSNVPGEKTSLTQPFPTRPAAFDRQGVTVDDLIDYTPELRAAAVQAAARYQLGPLFTPPLFAEPNGKLATMVLPHHTGGASWVGGSADPETGIVYVSSLTDIDLLAIIAADPSRSDMGYVGGRGGGGGGGRVAGPGAAGAPEGTPAARGRTLLGPQGLPLVKGPWGRITAIDLNTGNHVWMIPNGSAPDYIKNHPLLKGLDLGPTGKPERAPTMVTKTLLFAADGSGLFDAGTGAGGRALRAIDKKTGAIIHELQLPMSATGVPMTYLLKDKQYIVVATGERGMPAELVALAIR